MNSDGEKSINFVKRRSGESATEFKRRRHATIERLGLEERHLADLPSSRPSYRTNGFWEPRIQKWVGGCRSKFVDHRWIGEYIVECLWCGYPFETRDPRRRYCPGTSCKRAMFIYQRKSKVPRPKEQRCLNCDGIMEKRRGARFCCNLCTVTYHRREKKNRTLHV